MFIVKCIIHFYIKSITFSPELGGAADPF